MKKKFNLTAILAVVMVAMLSTNLVSCTADDEFECDSMYTMANGLFTRSTENGGTEQKKDSTIYIEPGNITLEGTPLYTFFDFNFSTEEYKTKVFLRMYLKDGEPYAELISFYNYFVSIYSLGTEYFTVDEVYFEESTDHYDGYLLCAKGHNFKGKIFYSKIEDRIFFK